MNYGFLEAVSTMICTVFQEKSNCNKHQEVQDQLNLLPMHVRKILQKKEDQIHQLNFIIDFRLIHISSKVRNL